MEDSISQRADLVATVITGVAFAVSNAVVTGLNNTALRAGWEIAVGQVEHVVKTSVIIRKLQMKRIYCVPFNFHTYSLAHLFLDVKG